jgi:hypothetical protein
MKRTVLLGSALALSFGFAAIAQPASQSPTAAKPSSSVPSAPPAASVNPPGPTAAPASPAPASATDAAAALKEGMVVKDSTGAAVGTIAQIGKTPDGAPAAVLDVDGKKIGVLASSLTPQGGQVISAATKAQLLAASAPATPAPKPG